jgi:hypothetical protein
MLAVVYTVFHKRDLVCLLQDSQLLRCSPCLAVLVATYPRLLRLMQPTLCLEANAMIATPTHPYLILLRQMMELMSARILFSLQW